MLPMLEDYQSLLKTLYSELGRIIEGLAPEALDWSPGPDMNSLAVLVVHATGAQRYWIGDVVGCDPSSRDRDAEFHTHGLDTATLAARLDAALAYTRAALEKLTLSDLEGRRVSPRDEREFTVAWSLGHVLEHTALHVGHAQIIRQLWNQRRIPSIPSEP